MRGTCEIVLKDKNNRIVHHEKEHNLVTNFFQEYFKELGPIKGLPYNYRIENMVGGILLFQNTIEEDADNVLLPAGNKMIGNAATLIVQGSGAAVKELGTYIADSTKWLDDETYQMKFEWAPSQAVGTIRAVCLTSRAHGFIGEGNESSYGQRSTPDSSQTNYEDFRQSYANLGYNQGHKAGGAICHCAYDNMAYRMIIDAAEGRVQVNKYKIPMNSIDFRTAFSEDVERLVESVSENIPYEYMEDIRQVTPSAYVSMSDEGKIYFLIGKCEYTSGTTRYCFSVNAAHPYIYCGTYNIADDSFTWKRINVYSYYVRETGFMAWYDGKYLLVAIDNYYYYVNQRCGVIDTEALTIEDVGGFIYGRNCTLYRCDNHQFYLYAGGNTPTSDTWGRGTKIDAVRGAWAPVNMTSNYNTSVYKVKGNKLAACTGYNPMNFNRHGDYLATIYNLPQAITKAADLTMQITYTLNFGENDG